MSSEAYKAYLKSGDNPCKYCHEGMSMSDRPGYHWTGNRNPPPCTALTEGQLLDQYAARNQRLADLVRFNRMELHQNGLISDEEYMLIVQDHDAVARLGSYDEVRQLLDQRTAELAQVNSQREYWKQSILTLQAQRNALQDKVERLAGELETARATPCDCCLVSCSHGCRCNKAREALEPREQAGRSRGGTE